MKLFSRTPREPQSVPSMTADAHLRSRTAPPSAPRGASRKRLLHHLSALFVWRTLLALAGFGFLCAAAWAIALPFGLAAVGLSLLAVDYLTTPTTPEGSPHG